MDPTAFAIVKSEVHRLPFVEDKIQAIVYAQGYLYAEQIGDLLIYDVSYDDDRMRVLQAAAAKMLPATCLGIITILRAFRSDSKKVQAVQFLSRQITDPLNFHVWNEVFPYQQERDTIRGIMTRQASAGVPPVPPTTTVQFTGNPYPYGRPKPKVNPEDPVYKLVDKSVDVVAGGIAAAANVLAPRPYHRGTVLRPGAVAYQTTTVTNYPNISVVNPTPGVQVIQTGPPPPPGAVQYTVIGAPTPPYPQQQYMRK